MDLKTYVITVPTHFAEYTYELDERGYKYADDIEHNDFGEIEGCQVIVSNISCPDVKHLLQERKRIAAEYRLELDSVVALEIVTKK